MSEKTPQSITWRLSQTAVQLRAFKYLETLTGEGMDGRTRNILQTGAKHQRRACEELGLDFEGIGAIALTIATHMAEAYLPAFPTEPSPETYHAHREGNYIPMIGRGSRPRKLSHRQQY